MSGMPPICRALLGIGLFVCAQVRAGAFTAYVSNEKSNTISIINTDELATTGTIKVGQRPRGIELTKDGKFILVAVGDDDTIQMIDTATHEIVATLPSGPSMRSGCSVRSRSSAMLKRHASQCSGGRKLVPGKSMA